MVRAEAEMIRAQPADEAARRSRGYWLLSRLFLEVPTASRLGEWRDALNDSTGDAAVLRAAMIASLADPDSAAVAFTRYLCLGNPGTGEPLPFESHVREGRLPGENTAHVAAAMADAGYEVVAPEATSPDHLGAELRFMALLCHAEHRCWLDGDRAAARASLRTQSTFVREHLGQWASAYCNGLAHRSPDNYVRTLAQVTAAAIAAEAVLVEDLCRVAADALDSMAPVT